MLRWMHALCALLLAAWPATAALADPFNQPWRRGDTVIVIDLHEQNDLDWSALAIDPRIVGVIHRATIGNVVDAAYAPRAMEAHARGLLWGAYHLGVEGDPIGQADLFLQTVGDHRNVFLALDLEDVDDPRRMNAEEALTFIARIRAKTGRTLAIYGNAKVVASLSADPRFHRTAQESALWYARYRDDIGAADLGAWKSYVLWQFSSHINCPPRARSCPYSIGGGHRDLDYNVFPGSREDLRTFWTGGGSPAPYIEARPAPASDDEAARTAQAEAQQREIDKLFGRGGLSQ